MATSQRAIDAPTKRQQEVLEIVREFLRDKGHSPSFGEIAERLKISKTSVSEHVNNLVARGHLRRVPGREKRNLIPTREPMIYLNGALNAVDESVRGKGKDDKIGALPSTIKGKLEALPQVS